MDFLVDDEGRKRTMYNKNTTITKIGVTTIKTFANQVSSLITV